MKKCILFSGGYDSIYCALKYKDYDLLFINYGQLYSKNELSSCEQFSKEKNRKLIKSHLNLKTDIKMRNIYLILEAMKLGYDEIILGTRNILPVFDKYKDSNFLTLYILSKILRIKIKMPLIGYSKKYIVKEIEKEYQGKPYNCYFNNLNFETCQCVNCEELRKIK